MLLMHVWVFQANNVPANPGSLQEINLPEEYRQTLDGEPFLLHDSGPASGIVYAGYIIFPLIPFHLISWFSSALNSSVTAGNVRFLVFSTQESLRLLERYDNWFADGTFKTVPLLFYQLYTLCVRANGKILPVVYALLPNKTQAMYESFLQVLLEHSEDLEPTTLVTDFELGAMNAFREKFPDIVCTGCFFHLSQNIFRKVQASGLQERYGQDAQFALAMRMLPALAFVPQGDVVQYFELLEDMFPDEAEDVITYFEHTYIGTLRGNSQRRTPMFPIALWNVHNRTLAGEERTNNAQEGWHRRFASVLTCHHPTIWVVIKALQVCSFGTTSCLSVYR